MSDMKGPRVRALPSEPDLSRFALAPLLPPPLLRSPQLEERLRQTHWKDIEASDAQTRPWSLYLQDRGAQDRATLPPWRPAGDEYTFGAGPLRPDSSANAGGGSGKGPRVLAREAERRPANTTIRSNAEDTKAGAESGWEVGLKAERSASVNQGEVEHGGSSERTVRQAAGQSVRESARHFDRKYPRDAEAKVEYKAWEGKSQLGQIKDETGPARGNLRALYSDGKVGSDAAASRKGVSASAGASGEIGALTAEGEIGRDSLVGAKAKARAAALEAEARALAEVKFAEREATLSGRLAASAVLADGEVGGEIRLTPRRVWNGLVITGVNTAASWLGFDKQLNEIDSLPDWGLVLGAGVSGTVGFAGEVSAEAYSNRRGFGAGGKVKLAPGLGGGLRLKGGVTYGD